MIPLVVLALVACSQDGPNDQRASTPTTSLDPSSEAPTTSGDLIEVFDDLDGDGVGANGTGQFVTEKLDRQAFVDGDCDDTDPSRWPGAPEDLCDGVDNDCDGEQPLCTREMTEGGATLVGFSDNRHIGTNVAFIGDVDGDGLEDIATSGDWIEPGIGAAYVISGADLPGIDGNIEPHIHASLYHSGGVSVGDDGLATAGDVNGDGLDEFWAGSPLHLVYGGAEGQLDVAASEVQIHANQQEVTRLLTEDVDGDGIRDLFYSDGRKEVFLFRGPFEPGTYTDADADLHIDFLDSEQFSDTTDAADFDGDGQLELLFGTECQIANEEEVYIAGIPGSTTGSHTPDSWSLMQHGFMDFWVDCGAFIGQSDIGGRSVGDQNGDGYADLGVARNGTWYVVPGPLDGRVVPEQDATLSVASHEILSTAPEATGDLDGDGTTEIHFLTHGNLAREDDAFRDGALYLFRGGHSGSMGIDDSDAVWRGQPSDRWAQMVVRAGGDVDADGIGDLLIGAPMSIEGYGYHPGHVYWLPGATLLHDL